MVEKREFAGKKAKIAAAELAKLSRRVSGELLGFHSLHCQCPFFFVFFINIFHLCPIYEFKVHLFLLVWSFLDGVQNEKKVIWVQFIRVFLWSL